MIRRLSELAQQFGSTLDRCLGMCAQKPDEQACPPSGENDASGFLNALERASVVCDTICVQDVSGSMAWKDCWPSRLEASKRAAEAYVRRRAAISPADRVAIVAFNDHGQVILPLTELHNVDQVLLHVTMLRPGGGTDIAAGLRAAIHLLRQDTWAHSGQGRCKRVLLLTDGCGGSPMRYARQLKNAGVLIEVIGVGGDPSDVDEALLRKVATKDSNGVVHYWFFQDGESLVSHYEDLAGGIVFKDHGK